MVTVKRQDIASHKPSMTCNSEHSKEAKEQKMGRQKKQRLTIYRLINIKSPIDALSEQYRPNLVTQSENNQDEDSQTIVDNCNENLQLKKTKCGDYEIHTICTNSQKRTPQWLTAINAISGHKYKVNNQYSGGILFIQNINSSNKNYSKQPKALWAITFGAGHTWIDSTKVDDLCGIRIAIRLNDPQEIRSINTNTLESKPKQVRTTTPTGSEINEFSFDEFRDFLTRINLSGSLKQGRNILKIRAADSISIPIKPDVNSVCEAIEQLEEILSREPNSGLAHLENLRPERNKNRIKLLDEQLIEALQDDNTTHPIGFMYPYNVFDSEGEPTEFKLINIPRQFAFNGSRKSRHFPPKNISELFGSLLSAITSNKDKTASAKQLTTLINSAKVQLFNDGGHMGRPVRLRDWLTNEQTVSSDPDHRYYLLNGKWFQLENSYIQQIETELSKIVEKSVTPEPLPHWSQDIPNEGKYNEILANAQDGLLLDKMLITLNNSSLRLEACDVLTKGGHFIHVKLTDSSATASHLVLQALNSAELLSYDSDVQEKLKCIISSVCTSNTRHDPKEFTHIPKTVTLVLAKSNATMTADSLYMFTKVSIVRAFKVLHRIGITLNVCFIKKETDRT